MATLRNNVRYTAVYVAADIIANRISSVANILTGDALVINQRTYLMVRQADDATKWAEVIGYLDSSGDLQVETPLNWVSGNTLWGDVFTGDVEIFSCLPSQATDKLIKDQDVIDVFIGWGQSNWKGSDGYISAQSQAVQDLIAALQPWDFRIKDWVIDYNSYPWATYRQPEIVGVPMKAYPYQMQQVDGAFGGNGPAYAFALEHVARTGRDVLFVNVAESGQRLCGTTDNFYCSADPTDGTEGAYAQQIKSRLQDVFDKDKFPAHRFAGILANIGESDSANGKRFTADFKPAFERVIDYIKYWTPETYLQSANDYANLPVVIMGGFSPYWDSSGNSSPNRSTWADEYEAGFEEWPNEHKYWGVAFQTSDSADIDYLPISGRSSNFIHRNAYGYNLLGKSYYRGYLRALENDPATSKPGTPIVSPVLTYVPASPLLQQVDVTWTQPASSQSIESYTKQYRINAASWQDLGSQPVGDARVDQVFAPLGSTVDYQVLATSSEGAGSYGRGTVVIGNTPVISGFAADAEEEQARIYMDADASSPALAALTLEWKLSTDQDIPGSWTNIVPAGALGDAIDQIVALTSGSTYDIRATKDNSAGTTISDIQVTPTAVPVGPSIIIDTVVATTDVNELVVSWTGTQGTGIITGYDVLWSVANANTWNEVLSLQNVLTHTIINLAWLATFDVKVIVHDDLGNSGQFIFEDVTTDADPSPLTAPVVIIDSAIVDGGALNTVNLAWHQDSGTVYDSYDLEYSVANSGAGPWLPLPAANGSGLLVENLPVTGLAWDTSFDFRVTINNAHSSSTAVIENIAVGSNPVITPAVTVGTTTLTGSELNQVQVLWTLDAGTGTITYKIEFSETTLNTWTVFTGAATIAQGVLTFLTTAGDLDWSKTYDIKITATSSEGGSGSDTKAAAVVIGADQNPLTAGWDNWPLVDSTTLAPLNEVVAGDTNVVWYLIAQGDYAQGVANTMEPPTNQSSDGQQVQQWNAWENNSGNTALEFSGSKYASMYTPNTPNERYADYYNEQVGRVGLGYGVVIGKGTEGSTEPNCLKMGSWDNDADNGKAIYNHINNFVKGIRFKVLDEATADNLPTRIIRDYWGSPNGGLELKSYRKSGENYFWIHSGDGGAASIVLEDDANATYVVGDWYTALIEGHGNGTLASVWIIKDTDDDLGMSQSAAVIDAASETMNPIAGTNTTAEAQYLGNYASSHANGQNDTRVMVSHYFCAETPTRWTEAQRIAIVNAMRGKGFVSP